MSLKKNARKSKTSIEPLVIESAARTVIYTPDCLRQLAEHDGVSVGVVCERLRRKEFEKQALERAAKNFEQEESCLWEQIQVLLVQIEQMKATADEAKACSPLKGRRKLQEISEMEIALQQTQLVAQQLSERHLRELQMAA